MNILQLKNVSLVCAMFLIFLVYITAGEGDKRAFADAMDSSQSLSVQQKKSVELFHEVFQITLENDKQANLDRIAELYWQIITTCPDAPLAQESHWRLIESYFTDYQPPRSEEALLLFKQFQSKYPDSPLMKVVRHTMARGLYMNKLWSDLLELEADGFAEFLATGEMTSPLPLFYYSEANFHLNEIDEAKKGYLILVERFPGTHVAQLGAEKLVQISKGMK